ncbi:ATP-dependent DNA helicase PIF1-like protein [Tanacetum coccineum]
MAPECASAETHFFLDNLELGVTGTIVLMFCRMWDVYAAMGRYLSTDFVVCDSKSDTSMNEKKEPLNQDAAGYMTNVGRTVQQKTGSKTLDFHLANSRSISRVTLLGLLERIVDLKRPAMLESGCIYQATTSSTLILRMMRKYMKFQQLKADSSIMSGPRMAGIFHPAEGKNARKALPVLTAALSVNPATKLYRLELEVSDDTAQVVVVMFNETATSLVKCTADSIAEYEDQQVDLHSPLPQALANIVGTSHTLEFKSHTYYEHNTYESFTCWRIVTAEAMGESGGSSMAAGSHAYESPKLKHLLRRPSVTTPSKVNEGKKHKSPPQASSGGSVAVPSGNNKDNRRVVDDNATS